MSEIEIIAGNPVVWGEENDGPRSQLFDSLVGLLHRGECSIENIHHLAAHITPEGESLAFFLGLDTFNTEGSSDAPVNLSIRLVSGNLLPTENDGHILLASSIDYVPGQTTYLLFAAISQDSTASLEKMDWRHVGSIIPDGSTISVHINRQDHGPAVIAEAVNKYSEISITFNTTNFQVETMAMNEIVAA